MSTFTAAMMDDETAALVAQMRETGRATVKLQYGDELLVARLDLGLPSMELEVAVLHLEDGKRLWTQSLSRKQRHQLAAILAWDQEDDDV